MTRICLLGLAALVLGFIVPLASTHAQQAVTPSSPASADGGLGSGLPNPSLGMGLSGVADWASQQPFIDVMKSARPWTGHLPDRYGAISSDDLTAGGYLDENGWLKSMPDEATGVSTLVLTDLPEEATSLNGRYRMTFKGTGTIQVQGHARNVERKGNEIWFAFVAGPGNLLITITKADPEGSGDYIRDIQIIKEENIPLHEVGAIFNPDWIERIKDLRLVRFMDWMSTNNSTVSEWGERPKVTDASYARVGVPVEVMVALANQIGADPWFTLPHLSTDEYIRRFAEVVRDNLDPALKAHVEFSNEVWNWQFQQAHWAEGQAKKRWGQDSKWVEYYGMRSAQMAEIWDDVFGDEATDRLVKVISTQTGWPGLEETVLNTPLWVAENPSQNRTAASYFDAYAITGYFAGALGNDDKAPTVKRWIAESRAAALAEANKRELSGSALDDYIAQHQYDQASHLAAQELRDGSVTGDKRDTLTELIGRTFPYHRDVAKKHDLDLIMYEGGTHVAASGNWIDDPNLTPFFVYLNYSPEMGSMYLELLAGWKAAGGTLFNAFVDVASPSKWGSWGALRHITDQNPRWDALSTFNTDIPGWWANREPDAFLHGVRKSALAGEERVEGTAKNDILLGGKDNDILVGAGGSDRLHGGPGDDVAILPGRFMDYTLRRDGELVTAVADRSTTVLYSVETLRFAGDPERSLQTSEIQ